MLEKIKEISMYILAGVIGIVGCFISAVFEVAVLIIGILGLLWIFGFIRF